MVTVIFFRVTIEIPLMSACFLPVSGQSTHSKVISKRDSCMRPSALIYQQGDLKKIHIRLSQLDWNSEAQSFPMRTSNYVFVK